MTDSIDIQRTLVRTIHNLYSALLCGSPMPLQRSILDYMKALPRPGDLVMEISTIYTTERDTVRLGRLIMVACELIPGDDGEVGEPPPTERAWYIRGPDGIERRWVNADFIRVPESLFR